MLTSYLIQLLDNPGWFAINVLVPVLLPFAVIAAVAMATGGWQAFIRMMKKSVEQGQLLWVALGMLASTGYEAFSAYGKCLELKGMASWALGLCILGAVFSSIFIALNTSRTLEEQAARTEVIWLSIFLTMLVSCAYPVLHVIFAQC
jgi:hypothetical protein